MPVQFSSVQFRPWPRAHLNGLKWPCKHLPPSPPSDDNGFDAGLDTGAARSVCLVTLSLSEAGPGRFGRQASVTDIYHAMPCHAGRVPSVHGTCYPVLAWSIQLRAYAMPSVPVPPITSLTDMVARCRLLAAHGAKSCPSVRTQPLTDTGAPSWTSTMPCHADHERRGQARSTRRGRMLIRNLIMKMFTSPNSPPTLPGNEMNKMEIECKSHPHPAQNLPISPAPGGPGP